MKRVNLFMMAVFIAASAVFMSCNSDPSDPPSIKVYFKVGSGAETESTNLEVEAFADEMITVKYEFNVPGGIKTIDIKEVNGSSLSGYPKTKDFTNANLAIETFSIEVDGPKTVEYIGEVTDKDKEPQSVNKKVKLIFKERPPQYGEITTKTAILLGAQDASAGSSYSTEKQQVYTVSQVVANSAFIDFIYYYQTGGSLAEIFSPKSSNASTLNSIKDMNPKRDTRFKKIEMSETDFNAIANDGVIVNVAKDFPTDATGQVVPNLSIGNVVAFKTDDGRLGVFRVTALTIGGTGSITLTVKVQE